MSVFFGGPADFFWPEIESDEELLTPEAQDSSASDEEIPIPVNHSQLKAEKISKSELKNVQKMADAWRKNASNKENLTNEPQEKQAFASSCGINGKISRALEDISNNPKGHPNTRAYKCVDPNKNIQGLMVVEKRSDVQSPHLYVNLLATHPNNLPSSVNDLENNRVRGAGVSLIECAKSVAQKRDFKSVELEPSETATDFYEKRGFEIQKSENNGVSKVRAVLKVTPKIEKK
jgi:hypothetical protein